MCVDGAMIVMICYNECVCVFAAEAQACEKASLQGIQQLVHRCFQTLALWKLLCEHQFSLIIAELPKVRGHLYTQMCFCLSLCL